MGAGVTFSFDSVLFAPLHEIFGTQATITPVTSASAATLTVIDRTSGIAVMLRGAEVETVHPAAIVRAVALAEAGLTRADLRRASLVMNGTTYRIDATQPRPTPAGEADGELLLILVENPA